MRHREIKRKEEIGTCVYVECVCVSVFLLYMFVRMCMCIQIIGYKLVLTNGSA